MPAAPRVSPPDLPAELAAGTAGRHADVFASRLVLGGAADLAHSSLEQCALDVDADAVDLAGSTLIDVHVDDARAASFSLREASMRRVRFSGGRIGTLDLTGARIDELELRDVRIDYLALAGAKASDLLIAGCDIRSLDMPQAQFTRVLFEACRSGEVDPRGLRATDVDLRGLDAAAWLDANGLRGTTLTTLQVQLLAPTLAAGVGIDVED